MRRLLSHLPRALGLAAALAVAGTTALPPALAGEPPAGAIDIKSVRLEQRLDERVPLDAAFRDENGSAVHLGDYFRDKPVVLVLYYNECPMLCSLVLSGLVGSMRAVSLEAGRDFAVLAVSFDPRDQPATAAKKKALYVKRYGHEGGEAGMHFLTGEQPSIDALTSAVGFHYEFDAKLGQYAHPSAVMVLTPDGRTARYLLGSEFSPRDLQLSLVEASDGKIGTLSDDLLLLCYSYDPAHGGYSASAIKALRLGGVATLLALGTFVGLSLRRERRQRRAAQKAGKPPTAPPPSGAGSDEETQP